MNTLLTCPQCHKSPDVKTDHNQVILSCPRHGHMAVGDSLDSARVHWNQYISFVSLKAA